MLVCDFHHGLIHKKGWRIELGRRAGVVHWFKPNYELYEPYEPNRAPPLRPEDLTSSIPQPELVGGLT